MNYRREGVLLAGIIALPMVAQAQPVSGPYIAGSIGVNKLQDISANGHILGTGTVQSDLGVATVLTAGWGFGNGLRVEIEGDFRSNKYDDVTDLGTADSAGGWEQKFGPMVNVVYDFNGMAPWVVPYAGLGVGYQWVNEKNVVAYNSNAAIGSVSVDDGTEGSFAYQAILGVALPLSQAAPGLAVTLEYRFMGLAGTRNYNSTVNVPGAPLTDTIGLNHDYNHSFLLGLRYNFGQAPTVAPVAAAPAPVAGVQAARSYLVFFDWDKATLTDRARQIVKDAAANSTHVQYTRIEVNGYTDTSGTPQYNMDLSIRRATAVKAELIKDGVPANAITTQGFGETHLLVPTGAGVREPQNRRVEIIIR